MESLSPTPIQKLLWERFETIRKKNASYSLRAFSKKLGVGLGTVSEVMQGKRKVSFKMAKKIADALLLDPIDRALVLGPYTDKIGTSPGTPVLNSLQLSTDQYQLLAEWHHFALLSLMKLPTFQDDPEWIADRLNITAKDATKSIERLERLGMIEKQNDKWVRRTPYYRTSDDVSNLSLRKSHYQTLERASHSLDHDAVEERDFTWLTFAFRSHEMSEAKTFIRKFQDEFTEKFGTPADGDRVYRLGMQLFPMSKKCVSKIAEKKKKKESEV